MGNHAGAAGRTRGKIIICADMTPSTFFFKAKADKATAARLPN